MSIEVEIYYKVICECKATNFVYGGYFTDPDLSKMDVDGFKCWNCKKVFSFIDEFEAEYPEDGLQNI